MHAGHRNTLSLHVGTPVTTSLGKCKKIWLFSCCVIKRHLSEIANITICTHMLAICSTHSNQFELLILLTLHTCSFLTDWLVVTVLAGLNRNASCIHYTYKHSEDVCMHHVKASSAISQWKYLFSRLQAGAGNPGFPLCDYLIEWHTFLQGSMQWQLENICFSPQSVDAKPGWMPGFVWLLLQRYVKLASNLCDEVSSCIKGPPDFAAPSLKPTLCTAAMDCGRSAAPDGVLMDVRAA